MAEKEATGQQTVFDTDRQYLGSVYAKALLNASKDAGKMDQVLEELDSFTNAMDGLGSVRAALESPRISFVEKEKLLEKIAGKGCSDEFRNFIKVLARKGRFDCLSAVRSNAQAMFNEIAGRVEATVVTADQIDDQLKASISSSLSKYLGKEVVVNTAVDPDIIGGMVVRVGDTVFDSSVANELKRVRHAAIGRANAEIRKSLERFSQN